MNSPTIPSSAGATLRMELYPNLFISVLDSPGIRVLLCIREFRFVGNPVPFFDLHDFDPTVQAIPTRSDLASVKEDDLNYLQWIKQHLRTRNFFGPPPMRFSIRSGALSVLTSW